MGNAEHKGVSIICPIDCGNAPKKLMLKEVAAALLLKDIDSVGEQLADQVAWHKVGEISYKGKEAVAKAAEAEKDNKAKEIQIETIITHGTTGAVNGTLATEALQRYAFCHIYQFTSAGKKGKIKEITSYMIKLA